MLRKDQWEAPGHGASDMGAAGTALALWYVL